MAAEATAHNLPTTSGQIVLGESTGEYLGYTVRETSGSATARVILYDSNGAPGAGAPILEEINLAAGADEKQNYQRPGRLFQNGIYAAITGAIEGAVFA